MIRKSCLNESLQFAIIVSLIDIFTIEDLSS